MLTQLGLTVANDHRDPKKLNLCGKGIFIMTTEKSDSSFSVVNVQGSLPGNAGSFPGTVPYKRQCAYGQLWRWRQESKPSHVSSNCRREYQGYAAKSNAFRSVIPIPCWNPAKSAKNQKKTASEETVLVPRDRIELPTRGFSVPCSTD